MAVTNAPHPLVTNVVAVLHQHVAGVAAPPASPTPAQLAAALAQAPELITFAGYIGGTLRDTSAGQSTTWRQFFLDSKLLTWLLVPDSDVVVDDRRPDDKAAFGHRDVIWVKANASVIRGSGAAVYLQGNFTRAGDFAASVTGGTFAPATGIFCEAQTPGCCGRHTS